MTSFVRLLYGAIGFHIETILIERLQETLIGISAAVLSALLIVPSRSSDDVRRAEEDILKSIHDVINRYTDEKTEETWKFHLRGYASWTFA